MVEFNCLSLNWFSLIPGFLVEPSRSVQYHQPCWAIRRFWPGICWAVSICPWMEIRQAMGWTWWIWPTILHVQTVSSRKQVWPYNEFNEWIFLFSDSSQAKTKLTEKRILQLLHPAHQGKKNTAQMSYVIPLHPVRMLRSSRRLCFWNRSQHWHDVGFDSLSVVTQCSTCSNWGSNYS